MLASPDSFHSLLVFSGIPVLAKSTQCLYLVVEDGSKSFSEDPFRKLLKSFSKTELKYLVKVFYLLRFSPLGSLQISEVSLQQMSGVKDTVSERSICPGGQVSKRPELGDTCQALVIQTI